MTTVSKTILANRAARREADANSRATKVLAAAFSKTYCADEDTDLVVDAKGRRVRQSDATADDIYALLVGNRVVDTIDILEQVGEKAFNNLVANGTLVRSADFNRFKSSNLYWITDKAVQLYGLPRQITLSTGLVADYKKAV